MKSTLSLTRKKTWRFQKGRVRLDSSKLGSAPPSDTLLQVAGTVGHEFNNQFQGIQGNLEMAQVFAEGDERILPLIQRSLAILKKSAALSQRLLEFSGRMVPLLAPLNLNELLASHEEGLNALIHEGDLELRLDPSIPKAEIDKDKILHILKELIQNSVDAHTRKITLSTSVELIDEAALHGEEWIEKPAPGQLLLLSLEDDGVSMVPQVRQQAFVPFFTTRSGNLGLGLSSVLGILRSHGAGLRLVTDPGRRTLFQLFFRPAQPDVPMQKPSRSNRPGRARAILVVDADEDLRITVSSLIREILKLPVLEASSGMEAIELFRQHKDTIALILMDATMPGMRGTDAFKAIQLLEPRARAILCSGYSQAYGENLAAQHGFTGFLKKPFAMRDLEALLLGLLPVTFEKSTPV